jgi:D-proline reductase (dithiol) PrdB
VSAIAHVLEAAGIATVGIASIRDQAVASRAPRLLYAEFPLGRPLGRPGDAAFQRRVLDAAFALLPRTDAPVLVDFPDVIVDRADEPLACAIPLADDATLHPAVREVLGLRAAFERQLAATGRTHVSRLGGADRVRELVETLIAVADGAPLDTLAVPATQLGAASLDVRAYFEEAATAIADHVPAARQAESWFFRSTHTGELMRRARAAIIAADGPRQAWFPMVTVGQPT